jgi:hypothetical protein
MNRDGSEMKLRVCSGLSMGAVVRCLYGCAHGMGCVMKGVGIRVA